MCRSYVCCVCTPVYLENDFELDAAANKIGILIKSWVEKCLAYVGLGCMGPITSWFAAGYVMSEAEVVCEHSLYALFINSTTKSPPNGDN